MSSTHSPEDNPPAFPFAATEFTDSRIESNPGMTLRDWFATACLPRLFPNNSCSYPAVARTAYAMADAMLAARKEAQP